VTPSMSCVRLDLHNHTSFSADGGLTPRELLSVAKARGLDCIAVTDHNTVRGGLSALSLSESDSTLPRVIPGIEVFTRDGEVIGLYVCEDIPKGTPLNEAVDRIRALGGVVYLPHPYDVFRRGAVSSGERENAVRRSDVVEVANGRALGPRAGAKSGRLAALCGKPRGAGSDAHHKREVGRAYVVVSELPTKETLAQLLSAGTIESGLHFWDYALNWGGQASSPLLRVWRRVTGSLPKE
jgi:predicted metal-dependent phosphoesterase TrpH